VSILLSVFNVTVDRSRCTYILAIKHRLGDVDDGDDDKDTYIIGNLFYFLSFVH